MGFNTARIQLQVQYRDSKPGIWLFVVSRELHSGSEVVEADSGIYFYPERLWEKCTEEAKRFGGVPKYWCWIWRNGVTQLIRKNNAA